MDGWEMDEAELMTERRRATLEMVLAESFDLGFLGSMPKEAQITHALGFALVVRQVFPEGHPASFVDLGTGGGVPGLVLACVWPDVPGVLLDASERRCAFLGEAAEALELMAVEVHRGRAEDIGREPKHRGRYGLATARSFGAPSVTAECAAPLLESGGFLIVSEPPDGGPGRWPEEPLVQLGLAVGPMYREFDTYGYQVLRKDGPTDDRFPRRVGVPAKRLLFHE